MQFSRVAQRGSGIALALYDTVDSLHHSLWFPRRRDVEEYQKIEEEVIRLNLAFPVWDPSSHHNKQQRRMAWDTGAPKHQHHQRQLFHPLAARLLADVG